MTFKCGPYQMVSDLVVFLCFICILHAIIFCLEAFSFLLSCTYEQLWPCLAVSFAIVLNIKQL